MESPPSANESSRKEARFRGNFQAAGPPAPTMSAGLLEALLAEEGPSGSTKAALRDEVSKFDTQPPDVRICKLEGCNDDGLKKIVFAQDNVELVQAVERALSAVGGRVCRGPAQAGPLEEQLSDWSALLTV